MSTKTAFVTGGTGFIGANVVRELLKEGYQVKALVRPSSNLSNLENLPVELVVGDLADAKSILTAVEGTHEVFHIGASYNFWSLNPKQMHLDNIVGTTNVMEAARIHNVQRVVYTSTVGTIGLSAQPQPCDEATPLIKGQFTSHYKRTKYEAEQIVLNYANKGLPVVIVNPSAPIGPFDIKPTPTGKIIVDFLNNKIPAYVDTGLNIVHVNDVARGHILAAQKGRFGERYILGNCNMPLEEILGTLAVITNRRPPTIKIPYALAYAVGAINTFISDYITYREPMVALEAVKMTKRYMYFSSEKAIRELGLPHTPPKQAFIDAVEWFVASGLVRVS